jgi:hypothetical protein
MTSGLIDVLYHSYVWLLILHFCLVTWCPITGLNTNKCGLQIFAPCDDSPRSLYRTIICVSRIWNSDLFFDEKASLRLSLPPGHDLDKHDRLAYGLPSPPNTDQSSDLASPQRKRKEKKKPCCKEREEESRVSGFLCTTPWKDSCSTGKAFALAVLLGRPPTRRRQRKSKPNKNTTVACIRGERGRRRASMACLHDHECESHNCAADWSLYNHVDIPKVFPPNPPSISLSCLSNQIGLASLQRSIRACPSCCISCTYGYFPPCSMAYRWWLWTNLWLGASNRSSSRGSSASRLLGYVRIPIICMYQQRRCRVDLGTPGGSS